MEERRREERRGEKKRGEERRRKERRGEERRREKRRGEERRREKKRGEKRRGNKVGVSVEDEFRGITRVVLGVTWAANEIGALNQICGLMVIEFSIEDA